MVEFAFVLPILLVLALGMLDFGKAFNYWLDETHLANEAARYAAVNANPGGGTNLQTWIKQQADTCELRGNCSTPKPNSMRVEITTPATFGDPVIVKACFHYNFLPFLASWIGIAPTKEIIGTAEMRSEQLATNYQAGTGGTGSACGT